MFGIGPGEYSVCDQGWGVDQLSPLPLVPTTHSLMLTASSPYQYTGLCAIVGAVFMGRVFLSVWFYRQSLIEYADNKLVWGVYDLFFPVPRA